MLQFLQKKSVNVQYLCIEIWNHLVVLRELLSCVQAHRNLPNGTQTFKSGHSCCSLAHTLTHTLTQREKERETYPRAQTETVSSVFIMSQAVYENSDSVNYFYDVMVSRSRTQLFIQHWMLVSYERAILFVFFCCHKLTINTLMTSSNSTVTLC